MLRFSLILAAALFLMTTQAQAGYSSSKDKYENTPTFGRAYCTPTFNCADLANRDMARTLTPQIVSAANNCLARKLNMRNPDGYIQQSMGLNSRLCLTTKKMPAAATGLTMTPECCLAPTSKNPNQCQIVCTKFGVR